MTEERTQSEGFFEMLWDCDHCGQRALLGKSQRHCPACGAPQNPAKRYMPSPDQQVKAEGHTYVGADRTCPACSAPMAAKANNCTQCGSPLDGAKEVGGATPAPVKRRRRIRPWLLAILSVVAVLGFAIWWLLIRTHEARLTVAAHRWERAIAIEQYGDQQKTAWRDQLPAAAQLPVCTRKQRSTRQIADGEDCHTERHDKKDGTFEQVKKCKPKYRSEPIDDDWCTFTVREWTKIDEAKTSGTGTSPAWPSQALPPAIAEPLVGARRQGAKTEKLTLDFGGSSCEVDDAIWRKYNDGDKVKVEVRARSGDVVCSSL